MKNWKSFLHRILYWFGDNPLSIKIKKLQYDMQYDQGHDHNKSKEQKHNDKEIETIKNSHFFDAKYYLTNNPDVAKEKIDPYEHYCLYGWKEGRNPSPFFNTNFYLQNNEDVKQANINPLYHFIVYGEKEGRYPTEMEKTLETVSCADLFTILSPQPDNKVLAKKYNKKIDILIPVYNGYNFLVPLFKSIFSNSTLPYRLLICDDKSPDEKIFPFLQKIKKDYSDIEILLLQNEKNLGFVGTVNKLVEYTKNHFVLLNTDTEVPPYWLERLMHPIINMENIATTTPFTNAGTICSFPNYLEDNINIMNNMSVDEIDAYFQKVNFEKTYIEIPTGVGFCMGVNKDLVDNIGMFDEVFGKGYGEENDFCQRAISNGYKNIHVTNLFVYHKHGGSFPSETKKKLIENNLQILNKKHPTYSQQVQKIIENNDLENLRKLLYFLIVASKNYSVLYIDHDLGGGAVDYRDMNIEKRLQNKEVVFLLTFDFKGSKKYIVKCLYEEESFKFVGDTIAELFQAIQLFQIDEIFLNSLVSYPKLRLFIENLLSLQSRDNCKMVIPVHDYFPLCPSYTLLNDKNEYCALPDDVNICQQCLKNNVDAEYKLFTPETDINKWRNMWELLLEHTDEVLCFSNASKEIFAKVYPQYLEKVKVIPHNISGRYQNIYEPSVGEEIRIGILGGINIAKGAYIVKNMVEYIDKNNINAKVILIGDIAINIDSPSFQKTGRYKKEELPSIVKSLNITKFFIPSIWPETFSYTTDEIVQMGYPLVVFDIGAPAERVRQYNKGYVFNGNLQDIDFKKLIGIFKNDIN